ncbi:MAG: dTMP kinase [Gaiellales bacterium]|jgi:dTMP kinase|nr:dTMP kinase [Gaiellales bacterium]
MFISFEGLDGSGKTTQATMLADALELEGREVVRVREPGGTPTGERIRELLLDPSATIAAPAEALLYAAARAQLVAEVIAPALARGSVVIADRFIDSSLAYQGTARGLGVDRILAVNQLATGGLMPDRTLLLQLPVALASERRGSAPDRIEAESAGFHRAVADGFAAAAARFPERIRVVDGSGPPRAVLARVREAVGV